MVLEFLQTNTPPNFFAAAHLRKLVGWHLLNTLSLTSKNRAMIKLAGIYLTVHVETIHTQQPPKAKAAPGENTGHKRPTKTTERSDHHTVHESQLEIRSGIAEAAIAKSKTGPDTETAKNS